MHKLELCICETSSKPTVVEVQLHFKLGLPYTIPILAFKNSFFNLFTFIGLLQLFSALIVKLGLITTKTRHA